MALFSGARTIKFNIRVLLITLSVFTTAVVVAPLTIYTFNQRTEAFQSSIIEADKISPQNNNYTTNITDNNNTSFLTYENPKLAFKMQYPSDWHVTDYSNFTVPKKTCEFTCNLSKHDYYLRSLQKDEVDFYPSGSRKTFTITRSSDLIKENPNLTPSELAYKQINSLKNETGVSNFQLLNQSQL